MPLLSPTTQAARPPRTLPQLLRARNVSFAASLLSMVCGGTLYLFSAYSTTLGYTQTQTNLIASSGGLGIYLSAPIMGALTDRYGPRRTATLSAFCLFSGYGCMALAYRASLSAALMAICYASVGLGSAAGYNAALTTNVRNFDPRMHGLVVGTSVSLFGLSAFIFSQLSKLFYYPVAQHSEAVGSSSGPTAIDTFGFLLFLALATGGANLVASMGLQDVSKELGRAVVGTISPGSMGNNSTESSVLIGEEDRQSDSEPDDEGAAAAEVTTAPTSLFHRPDAWILWLAFLSLSGTGLMYINNIGAIILALSPPHTTTTLLPRAVVTNSIASTQAHHVSLISIFNCLGRITTGVASDAAYSRYATPRLVFLLGAAGVMFVAQVVVTFLPESITLSTSTATLIPPTHLLTLATTLVGFSYGSLFSTAPVIVSKWFGVAGFGTHWGWFQWGPAVGGQVLNMVFGVVMDSRTPKSADHADGTHNTSKQHPQCTGTHCFRPAFILSASLTAFAIGCLVVLCVRKPWAAQGYDAVPARRGRRDGGNEVDAGGVDRRSGGRIRRIVGEEVPEG
ncbi:major facilitator superfamily domain-containing protein [Fimicolochytrium jonesii]|uniref:major facilitator superfamily domain-containing protein n=1 Tax=Fimicolochytrium jonesii TaxID=1396493 RepID=UPI0022FEB8C1|nr:major facilitator superfamily domain-containing protein [Fimicolochytrium jonesii]KAI8820966.1 major facilitator superfamily domain-containing protein [Fimicolochytrium jonesii]